MQTHVIQMTVKIKNNCTSLSTYLHSTLSVVFAVFGGLLLFDALHWSGFLLSSFFPVITIDLLYVTTALVRFDPINQEIFGAGTALWLTSHDMFLWAPSLIVKNISLGFKETFWTSTVKHCLKNGL